jgi:DNA-binding transcriptional regulator PaaX
MEAQQLNSWLLFLYKVPHEPSTRRVYVWRKLKRLGAVMLHDSAWVLPQVPSNLEQLRKLAKEVVDLGGDSLLWEAHLAGDDQEETLLVQLSASHRQAPVEVS